MDTIFKKLNFYYIFQYSILPLLISLFFLLSSCKKNDSGSTIKYTRNPKADSVIVFAANSLDTFSAINKTSSWYKTNRSFDELFDERQSPVAGFELTPENKFIPYAGNSNGVWNANKNYYWFGLGSYIYTDLTGDGKKDLWAFYWKNPWPTNAKGIHFFTDCLSDTNHYNIQLGLTEVRKTVLADVNNDKKNEIVIFSTGFDGMPFPGDSIAIFYPATNTYKYLSDDMGYFQGGTTGDVNGDGWVDIIAYSGGSKSVPIHPVAYLNMGNNCFKLSNQIFKGFTSSRDDNYYTVELFDINNDGSLDLFLGAYEKLRLILNNNTVFNKSSMINIPVLTGLELMDMAFMDFDGDGKMDILTLNNKNMYQGYALRLYLNRGATFIEVTNQFFDLFEGVGKDTWIKWIHLFDKDKDGDLDIVADGLYGELYDAHRKIYWQNNAGYFKRVIE